MVQSFQSYLCGFRKPVLSAKLGVWVARAVVSLPVHLGGLQFPLSLWDHLELVVRACFSHPLIGSSNVTFSNQPLWDFNIPLSYSQKVSTPVLVFSTASSFWSGISVLLSVSSRVPPIWRLSDFSAGSGVCFTLWFLTGLGAGSLTSFIVVIRHFNKSNLGEKGFIWWITIPGFSP